MNVALIAPPWPLFNRPSLQLAALKAYLRRHAPEIAVRTFHPYLELASALGPDRYHPISESSWAAEAVAAGLLHPERAASSDRLFAQALGSRRGSAGRRNGGLQLSAAEVRAVTGDALRTFVNGQDWQAFQLIGLTVSLNQLTSALYLAELIKAKVPALPIVLGGPSCAGSLGPGLLEAYSEIDYVVNGEGERPLLDLVRHIRGDNADLPLGVVSRDNPPSPGSPPEQNQLPDITDLPAPDFDDYFRELQRLPPRHRFFPVLPVEFSRGCWWNRCHFCNLNLQWSGYRTKSVEGMAAEIDHLARRYQTLDFAFMDNALPRHTAAPLFQALDGHRRDYHFFAELRAVHGRKEMAEMAKGGLRDVQIGIEALSTSLLTRLRKGSRAMDNVAAMRHAEEAGVALGGNLILHFPGSTEDEVRETLDVLDFLWPYRPLKTVSYWLGFGSPVADRPQDFGLSGLRPHPFYKALFPENMLGNRIYLILSSRGDRQRQRRLWRPVENRVEIWNRRRSQIGLEERLLTYRDGGDFLLIRQVLADGAVLHHRLQGPSRRLYLKCLNPVSIRELKEEPPGFSEEKIRKFVDDLAAKRLMFSDGHRVLALAITEKRR